MYFYIDESGHTGSNLFDEEQPNFYFGVLYSSVNLDILLQSRMKKIKEKIGAGRLHANELGNGELVKIADNLLKIQKDYRLIFDIYLVNKPDSAKIVFFDRVIISDKNLAVNSENAGINRYPLLLEISSLFDNQLLQKAWNSFNESNKTESNKLLKEVCESLLSLVHKIQEKSYQSIIKNALEWVIQYPNELDYNASSKTMRLQFSPNQFGFQMTLMGIGDQIKKYSKKKGNPKKPNVSIIIDQQVQFNKAQRDLLNYFQSRRNEPYIVGPELPEISFKDIPECEIKISSSSNSIGLELADVFLWIFKRKSEGKALASELNNIIKENKQKIPTEQRSLVMIKNKIEKFNRKIEKKG